MDLEREKIVNLDRGGSHVDADQTDRFRRVVLNNVNHLAIRIRQGRTGVLVDDGMKEGAARLAGWSPRDASEEPACFVDGVRKVLAELESDLGVQVVWLDQRRAGEKVWQVNLVRPDVHTNGQTVQ